MGLILELARAKQKITELETKISELESNQEFYEKYQPTSTRQVSFDELYLILYRHFPNVQLLLGENYRFLCNHDDIAVFLAQDQTNKFEYISDRKEISSMDCNVFANRLLGQFSVPGWCDLCFGKVWLRVPSHALNAVLTEDEKFFYIEPQTDELLDYSFYESSSVRFVEM